MSRYIEALEALAEFEAETTGVVSTHIEARLIEAGHIINHNETEYESEE